jgi:hypothetical protein
MKSETTNEDLAVPEAPAQETNPIPTKAPRKARGEVTLGELAERYIKHLEDDRSPGTCASYGAEMKLACKELGADTQISQLTPEQVQAYFDCKPVTKLRSGKKKSQLSIDKTRRVLRLALVWAAAAKLIPRAPLPEEAATH